MAVLTAPASAAGGADYAEQAVAAYRAARAINADPGVVGRVRGLLDLLAMADGAGVVAQIKKEI